MTHVVVLAGGLSPERDVSVRSGRRVAAALRDHGIDVTERDVDADLIGSLATLQPDAVVPMLHGAVGEDGALRAVLEALHLPFLGSTSAACARAFDKSIANGLVAEGGVDVPASITLPQGAFRELGAHAVLDAVLQALGLPIVVKPNRGGSALGVTIVHDAQTLPAAMVAAFAYGDVVVLQRAVTGTELAVSVLEDDGVQVLPAVEIVAPDGFYDYQARYVAGTTEFFVPARLSSDTLDRAAAVAALVHRTLGLRDWSRTDLIVDDTGTVWFLEVNAAPGMTETSLYPQSLAAAGLDVGPVTAELIARALAR